MVFGHRHGQRRALVLPVGDQFVRAPWDRSPRRTGCARRPRCPFRACRPTTSRPGFARRVASAGSPRRARPAPAPTITTSYCHRFAVAHRFLSSRRQGVFAHAMPCQFLDRAVNSDEGSAHGRGPRPIDCGRGCQRAWLVDRGRGRRRRPGSTARLAKPAHALATAAVEPAPPSPIVAEPGHETCQFDASATGSATAPCPAARRPRNSAGLAPAAPKPHRSCCWRHADASRMSPRAQPIGGEAWH